MSEQVHSRDVIYQPFRVEGTLKMIIKPFTSILLGESSVMGEHVILDR